MRWITIISLALIALTGCEMPQRIGDPGQTTLPTGRKLQTPGQRLEMVGRPVDAIFSANGKAIIIKDFNAVRAVDVATHKILSSVSLPGGASLTGLAQRPGTNEVWVTNATNAVSLVNIANPAALAITKSYTLTGPNGSGNSFPCGITFNSDGSRAYIALSINNQVRCLNPATGATVWNANVGIAPYGVAFHNNKLVVSEQGGVKPPTTDPSAPSAGTKVEIDGRGVAAGGSVSILNAATGASLAQIRTGLQPGAIALDPATSTAYVCEANNDMVSIYNLTTNKKTGSILTKPDPRLPFGSMPNAIALDKKNNRIYVANAGNNALAVFDLSTRKLLGQIPTDWYPTAVLINNTSVYSLNNKGIGARPIDGQTKTAYNSHEKNGTLVKLAIPNAETLASYSNLAADLSQQAQILTAMERDRGPRVRPVPIPSKLGQPSVFKHVIYVIKENRTYDQFFGNLPQGKGMPSLNIFTDDHVPNQRALAKQFVLLDNYYCNGVLSADGHSWATEGNLTPYLNRAFGGFTRSYTFGDDPITYSVSGFIWDGILAAGLSFRNYGEFDYATPPTGMTARQIWDRYKAGEITTFGQNIGVSNLRRYSCREYPGWNMNIPDVLRMDRFLKEFREFEASGDLPNFMVVYLPQDHAGGAVTPASHMADNDLAVGRLVEAVSKSKFWPETAIFINEDDPQAGTDHVDGHRSICLVVSPYSRNLGTISEFYNQDSVLKTINRIFGIAPMNQMEAGVNVMSSCFGAKVDRTPYTAITPIQPLDQWNTQEALGEKAFQLLAKVQKIDLRKREVQTENEMTTLSHFVWHAQKGNEPYPTEWAGPHGRGLAERGLKFGKSGGIDDDD